MIFILLFVFFCFIVGAYRRTLTRGIFTVFTQADTCEGNQGNNDTFMALC